MTTFSRSLWLIMFSVILGLVIFTVEALGQPLQAIGLWLAATGLFCASLVMVFRPRQLVARHAGAVGTRRP